MSDDIPDILKAESVEHYQADAANYFRNLKHKEHISGPSADDMQKARPHLLTPKQESDYADRVDLAANKTRRSGARVNDSSAVPAIFMQGMKETSELIDEFSVKNWKPPEEMKPVAEQIAPTGFFEKAEAVVEHLCLDCLEPFSPQKYTLGVTMATEEDVERSGNNVSFGATVLYIICGKCWEAAKELARDKTPLVYVFGGGLIPPEEVAIAVKYGFPVNLHEGSEKSRGQWELVKRAERLMDTLWQIIRAQTEDSWVFVRNRQKDAK